MKLTWRENYFVLMDFWITAFENKFRLWFLSKFGVWNMPGLGCKLFWINKYLNSGDIFDCWNHGTNNVSMFHVEIGQITIF